MIKKKKLFSRLFIDGTNQNLNRGVVEKKSDLC